MENVSVEEGLNYAGKGILLEAAWNPPAGLPTSLLLPTNLAKPALRLNAVQNLQAAVEPWVVPGPIDSEVGMRISNETGVPGRLKSTQTN